MTLTNLAASISRGSAPSTTPPAPSARAHSSGTSPKVWSPCMCVRNCRTTHSPVHQSIDWFRWSAGTVVQFCSRSTASAWNAVVGAASLRQGQRTTSVAITGSKLAPGRTCGGCSTCTSPSRRIAVDETFRVLEGDPALVPSQVLGKQRGGMLSLSAQYTVTTTRRTSRGCRASYRAVPSDAIRWRLANSSASSSSGRNDIETESCASLSQVPETQQYRALSSCLLSWTCEVEFTSR